MPCYFGMCTHATQGVSITGKPTSSEQRQQASPADAEGTLRAELLGRLLGAQAELEAQLAALQRNADTAGLVAECSTQLSALYALQKNISTASPAALIALRGEVSTSITAASSAALQVRSGTAGAGAISAELATVSASTRSEVQALSADLFERRIFDRDLVFSSPEDEAAYRQCEAESRRYIEDQLARKTPEGDLNAAGGTMGHMLDAHAHGAGTNPEFLPRWTQLVETTRKQRDAMRHDGRSTDEFDRNVSDSVRRYLKAKGVPEAEIEARLAASADPLAAVKPYLRDEHDAKLLSLSVQLAAQPSTELKVVERTAPDQTSSTGSVIAQRAEIRTGLDDVMAKLRATGVAGSAEPVTGEFAHGVAIQEPGAPSRGRSTPG